MTKPLSTGCIKQQEKLLTSREFNLLLESVDLDNKLGQLLFLDIRFNKEEVTPREFMCNEIYCLIFDKGKTIDATERSVFQLSESLQENDEVDPRSYLCSKKIYVTMFEKTFMLLYLEHSVFLIKRAELQLTKSTLAILSNKRGL